MLDFQMHHSEATPRLWPQEINAAPLRDFCNCPVSVGKNAARAMEHQALSDTHEGTQILLLNYPRQAVHGSQQQCWVTPPLSAAEYLNSSAACNAGGSSSRDTLGLAFARKGHMHLRPDCTSFTRTSAIASTTGTTNSENED